MIFGVLNPEKIDINSLYTCPPHLYTVATLPWEIQKVIFQNNPFSPAFFWLQQNESTKSFRTILV